MLLDLVYVFVLTRLSQRLIEDFTTERRIFLLEAGQTTLLFLAAWLLWVTAGWVSGLYDPRQWTMQAGIVWTMFGSMLIAVTLHDAFSTRGLVFALAYVGVYLGLAVLGLIARRLNRDPVISPIRALIWTGTAAVLWVAGGALFPESPARVALWTVAVLSHYMGFLAGWYVPRLGHTSMAELNPSGRHLVERYQQCVIITLGETILLTGLTFSTEFTPDRVLPTVSSFLATVLMFRIYFFRAGELLPATVDAAPRPGRLARSGLYTHLVLVAGILITGVGHALVISQPHERPDPIRLVLFLGGPALFLAGRARLEYEVFGRVSASRVVGMLALGALTPATLPAPAVVAATTTTLVLAGVAVWDRLRAAKMGLAAPSPPG
ncbi:low temperature requirement protein A [Micromonospora sp. URMC 103]|uniref:low temperature requirement protein A n=1 Tax=Micromonospora sp. URMC 103 TaxID=3423406 RepID=UPI003F1AEAD1